MTRFLFFSGKGGVGKTTMACATAVAEALQGHRTLIVTTDPASNLADVFEQPIGHQVTAIAGVSGLSAMEIDPDKATDEYRERVLAPFRAALPADVVRVMEEQFRSPCTTEIAAFDRFVDFINDEGGYDTVVFDTAPTGHTLRLLELPVDWSHHIEESVKGGGQTCLGPVQAIQASKLKYDRAISALRDHNRTRFVFVLQAEHTAILETARSMEDLGRLGIESQELIVNGLLPRDACGLPFFRRRYDLQQRHMGEIRARFATPIREMFLRDDEVKGVASLKDVAGSLAGRVAPSARVAEPAQPMPEAPRRSSVGLERLLSPPKGGSKLAFFTGKGGVGKTSVSCVAAMHLARRGLRTLLVTTDPAAHIGDVLDIDVTGQPRPLPALPALSVARIDAKQATADYKARILAEARGRYSADMLLALQEELESPCTEEMAAFDKFTEYADGHEYDVTVFDTAPTGHTVRLLQMPFDYSQQVEMLVATTQESVGLKAQTSERFGRIIARLKDPERTAFVFVVYPESTPVVEAHRASLDLADAGIRTQAVVANQVIPFELATNAFFRRRRAMQARYLAEIESRFGVPVFQLPLLDHEIRGFDAIDTAAALLFEDEAASTQEAAKSR